MLTHAVSTECLSLLLLLLEERHGQDHYFPDLSYPALLRKDQDIDARLWGHTRKTSRTISPVFLGPDVTKLSMDLKLKAGWMACCSSVLARSQGQWLSVLGAFQT